MSRTSSPHMPMNSANEFVRQGLWQSIDCTSSFDGCNDRRNCFEAFASRRNYFYYFFAHPCLRCTLGITFSSSFSHTLFLFSSFLNQCHDHVTRQKQRVCQRALFPEAYNRQFKSILVYWQFIQPFDSRICRSCWFFGYRQQDWKVNILAGAAFSRREYSCFLRLRIVIEARETYTVLRAPASVSPS